MPAEPSRLESPERFTPGRSLYSRHATLGVHHRAADGILRTGLRLVRPLATTDTRRAPVRPAKRPGRPAQLLVGQGLT